MSLPEGYKTDSGFDPAEDHIGPFYFMDGPPPVYAFVAAAKNCNAHGAIHGGVLMTFADYAICMAATDHYTGESCVTVTFNSEFVAAAELGDLVEAHVSVTHKTRSMGFVTGSLKVGERTVMTFSSVVKRLIDRDPT